MPQSQDQPFDDGFDIAEALDRLLDQLRRSGPATDDQVARLCLTTRELAGVIHPDDQAANAARTVEALGQFLDESGPTSPLGSAIRDWRKLTESTRRRFGWLELPPVLRQRAHERAAALLRMAKDRGLIAPGEEPESWRLTER